MIFGARLSGQSHTGETRRLIRPKFGMQLNTIKQCIDLILLSYRFCGTQWLDLIDGPSHFRSLHPTKPELIFISRLHSFALIVLGHRSAMNSSIWTDQRTRVAGCAYCEVVDCEGEFLLNSSSSPSSLGRWQVTTNSLTNSLTPLSTVYLALCGQFLKRHFLVRSIINTITTGVKTTQSELTSAHVWWANTFD